MMMDQLVTKMDVLMARQIHSCVTIHPAKLSALGRRWQ
jgi:hypothetical protein